MRTTLRARLATLLVSGMLVLAPLPSMAEVFKCKQDGKFTYSTSPCGSKQLQVATELSVTPGHQPAESTRGSSGNWFGAIGLSGQSVIPLLLFLLIPLAVAVALFLWRRSSKKQKEQRLLPPYLP